MDLEERVRDLVERENDEMAEELAKGALSQQSIQNFQLTQDGIRVETRHFVGHHPLHPDGQTIQTQLATNGHIDIGNVTVRDGTYHLKNSDITLEVELHSPPSEEIKTFLADKQLTTDTHSNNPHDQGTPTESTTGHQQSSPGAEQKVITDGGQPGVLSQIVHLLRRCFS